MADFMAQPVATPDYTSPPSVRKDAPPFGADPFQNPSNYKTVIIDVF